MRQKLSQLYRKEIPKIPAHSVLTRVINSSDSEGYSTTRPFGGLYRVKKLQIKVLKKRLKKFNLASQKHVRCHIGGGIY